MRVVVVAVIGIGVSPATTTTTAAPPLLAVAAVFVSVVVGLHEKLRLVVGVPNADDLLRLLLLLPLSCLWMMILLHTCRVTLQLWVHRSKQLVNQSALLLVG